VVAGFYRTCVIKAVLERPSATTCDAPGASRVTTLTRVVPTREPTCDTTELGRSSPATQLLLAVHGLELRIPEDASIVAQGPMLIDVPPRLRVRQGFRVDSSDGLVERRVRRKSPVVLRDRCSPWSIVRLHTLMLVLQPPTRRDVPRA
jgi:hypothetical protein